MNADDDALTRLDASLLDLRRFAQAPADLGDDVHVDRGAAVQVSTMLVVDAVARHGGGAECSVGDVAEALDVVHSTASRLVARAETAGMVQRGRSAVDPRRTALSLTPEGRDLQHRAVGFRRARLESLLSDWSAPDIRTFTRLLERFAHAARESGQESPSESSG